MEIKSKKYWILLGLFAIPTCLHGLSIYLQSMANFGYIDNTSFEIIFPYLEYSYIFDKLESFFFIIALPIIFPIFLLKAFIYSIPYPIVTISVFEILYIWGLLIYILSKLYKNGLNKGILLIFFIIISVLNSTSASIISQKIYSQIFKIQSNNYLSSMNNWEESDLTFTITSTSPIKEIYNSGLYERGFDINVKTILPQTLSTLPFFNIEIVSGIKNTEIANNRGLPQSYSDRYNILVENDGDKLKFFQVFPKDGSMSDEEKPSDKRKIPLNTNKDNEFTLFLRDKHNLPLALEIRYSMGVNTNIFDDMIQKYYPHKKYSGDAELKVSNLFDMVKDEIRRYRGEKLGTLVSLPKNQKFIVAPLP